LTDGGSNPPSPANQLVGNLLVSENKYKMFKETNRLAHHTKDKGDLGLLKAQVALCEQGYIVLTPQTEHAPFDLVGYKDGVFHRFQVKYRKKNKVGTINAVLRTSWADKNGNHVKYYGKNDFDYFCVYCPDSDKCYFISMKFMKDKISVALRLDKTKNNQNQGVFLAEEFLKIK
jgi:hypothetical protein